MTVKYAIDHRPFKDRIIWGLGYKENVALTLSYDKGLCKGDFGSLMQTHTFEIATDIKGTFLRRNTDIDALNSWSDHYRAGKIPFLVVRESTRQIAIYKQRIEIGKGQADYAESSGKRDLGLTNQYPMSDNLGYLTGE